VRSPDRAQEGPKLIGFGWEARRDEAANQITVGLLERQRAFDMVMAWSVDRLTPAGFGRHSLRIARAKHRPIPAPTEPRHDDPRRQDAVSQGAVSDDKRFFRVRAGDDCGTSPCRARGEGKEFLFAEDIFGFFGKLPVHHRLVPKEIIPIHACHCAEDLS